MSSCDANVTTPVHKIARTIFPDNRAPAFTLVELLVVVSIMLVLMALIAPAFNAIQGGNNVSTAAYDVAGALQTARSYAMAHNTYAWVGFYEEDAGAVTPTNQTPPYTGKGQIILAVVASTDGSTDLTPAVLSPVGKIARIKNVHLADIGAPSSSRAGIPSPSPAGRIQPTLTVKAAAPITIIGSIVKARTRRISPSPPKATLFINPSASAPRARPRSPLTIPVEAAAIGNMARGRSSKSA